MVNPGEALVNAVMSNKRKLLTRLGQNGKWSSPWANQSCGADVAPPANRRGLTHPATTTERGKPVVAPRGKANRKGRRCGCG